MDISKIFEDESLLIIAHFFIQQHKETGKLLRELEDELRISNRFFPWSKMIDKISSLSEISRIRLEKGTKLYRCRLIEKDNENKVMGKHSDELLNVIRKFVPSFDENGGMEQLLLLSLYFEAHPEELPRWEAARQQFIIQHSNQAFWGYDESGSDVPPEGFSYSGRINPDGIRYLYAAEDIRTAILEVRPVPTQYVSVATVEIVEDINIYSFAKSVEPDKEGENWVSWIDYDEVSRYFSAPNYGGKSYYLATQYISEYIKHMKDLSGKVMFDGLCFRSSLNPDGINYVLFDVSPDRKYKICNSALYQVNDLLGNSTCIFPIDESLDNIQI